MLAALRKVTEGDPEHVFRHVDLGEFSKLARQYETELRRIQGRKPKKRRAAIERAQRVHDAAAAGMSQKAIALTEGITEGRVSQILREPRPD